MKILFIITAILGICMLALSIYGILQHSSKDPNGNGITKIKDIIYEANPFLKAWNSYPKYSMWSGLVEAKAPDMHIVYHVRSGKGIYQNDDAGVSEVSNMTFTIGPSKDGSGTTKIIGNRKTATMGNDM